MIEIDLDIQQALAADPKAMHQNNFPGNLVREGNTEKKIYETIIYRKLF